MHKYLIGFAKIACDAFGLPDLYTYLLAHSGYKNYFFILPFSLIADTLLSFPLGTFFTIDFAAFTLWRELRRSTHYADHALVLYAIRYCGLYIVGMAHEIILNQVLYCIFFGVVFRIVRGSRKTAFLYQ